MKVLPSIFFCICLLISGGSGFAQFSLGPRAGIQFIDYGESDANFDEFSKRLSPFFGAVAELRFNRYFAIQSELALAFKGFKGKASYDEPGAGMITESVDAKWLEIQIPLVAKLGFPFQWGRFDALIGPGFHTELKQEYTYSKTIAGSTQPAPNYYYLKPVKFDDTDISLQYGAAISVNFLEPATLFLDARFMKGNTAIGLGAFFPL